MTLFKTGLHIVVRLCESRGEIFFALNMKIVKAWPEVMHSSTLDSALPGKQ
jgi:hypothetical protein